MARKRICAYCKRYKPSEKLDWQTFSKMSLRYTGWCQHYREERDDDEPICENYLHRGKERVKV